MEALQPSTFGELVRRYRRRSGLTQEELAERAELSPRGLIYLERGERSPHPGTARRLADALGLDEDERASLLAAAGTDLAGGRGDAGDTVRQFTVVAAPIARLPVELTPFIGREREVAEISSLIRRASVRLVTLTGPGGSGKTRIAARVGSEALDAFPDGVVFVALAPMSDPRLLAPALAGELGVKDTGGLPVVDALKARIAGKRLLLVLDNFEHLLEAAPIAGELLAACPGLAVLATSRTCLHLVAEHEYPVPPLALPARAEAGDLDAVAGADAVSFFLDRTRSVKPDFALTDRNAPAVVEICYRLDGLPLAIELAAARLRLLSPQALLDRLGSRLDLLASSARDVPDRQRTLRAAIDWSYGLLAPEQQRLFARLAVFHGGCSLEAAEVVCGSWQDVDVLPALTALVEQSLVRQSEGPAGEPRFAMLETIHAYAAEKLQTCDEFERMVERQAAYYLDLAEREERNDSDNASWFAQVRGDEDNFRAALEAFLGRGRVEEELRLSWTLLDYWATSGLQSEGRQWFDRGLEADNGVDRSVRCKALNGTANLARQQGEYDRAISLYRECVELADEIGDRTRSASALNSWGAAVMAQGDFDQALTLCTQALALFQEFGIEWGEGYALMNLAEAAARTGDLERARELFQQAATVERRLGNVWALVHIQGALGETARWSGDLPAAKAWFEETLETAREIGHAGGEGTALVGLANVALDTGSFASSVAMLQASLPIFRRIGDEPSLADAVETVGRLAAAQRVPRIAAKLWSAAASWRRGARVPPAPFMLQYFERLLPETRVNCGGHAWDIAWNDGQAMSLDGAADLAQTYLTGSSPSGSR